MFKLLFAELNFFFFSIEGLICHVNRLTLFAVFIAGWRLGKSIGASVTVMHVACLEVEPRPLVFLSPVTDR